MKVLQVHTEYREPGGEDAVVRTEEALLRQAGHTVTVHRERNSSNPLRASADMLQAPWNTFAARRIERLVTEIRPDVTHFHNTWFRMSPAVFGAARRAGSATVATLHNYRSVCPSALMLRDDRPCELCVHGKSVRHAIRYRCFRQSYLLSSLAAANVALNRSRDTWSRDLDLVVALSDFARSKLIEGGLGERNIVVKPNCVPHPGSRSRRAEESDRVIFVGRLSREKGVEVLLEAWKRASISDLVLEVIGDGVLAALVSNAGLPGLIVRGRLSAEEVRVRMLDCRALVLPSIWYEGALPLVAIEALSAGLPVLSSRLGAMAGLAGPLGAEWLIEPNDVRALVRGLRMLTEDHAVADASRRARAEYEQCYATARGLGELEGLYEEAIRRRAGGAR